MEELMNHKLLRTFLGTYIVFLIGSLITSAFLTPKLLRYYLYAISEAEDYRNYLTSQFVAIQNVCHLLMAIIILLSLLPLLFFWVKIYLPLNGIIQAAALYTDGYHHDPIAYDDDDELGRLTASLNYLADNTKNSGEYQRKFLSNISHDFRSPLTSIKGYVEAMLDGTIPVEMQDKYLNIVLSETERLNKLTEGILLLNNFADHGVYLEKTEFDIIAIIQNTIDSFEGTCRKKNLSIQTAFPGNPVLVYADMGKIQQVLYNLLDNAIKFSRSSSEILISVSEQRNRVFVSIKDYGEGIANENLPKIWDRFYKTDSSRGKDKKGTGLGLSIVKEIIRAHEQNINVISTEGAGTEFVFTLSKK